MFFPKLRVTFERYKYNKAYNIYVSNIGNLYDRDKKLLQKFSFSGYQRVNVNGKFLLVHRVVAETWLKCFTPDCTVDHLDGNGKNNAVSNLQCVSEAENLRRAMSNNPPELQREKDKKAPPESIKGRRKFIEEKREKIFTAITTAPAFNGDEIIKYDGEEKSVLTILRTLKDVDKCSPCDIKGVYDLIVKLPTAKQCQKYGHIFVKPNPKKEGI